MARTNVAVSNSDDVIDSRDIIARVEELEDMEPDEPDYDAEELAALKALQDEATGYSEDWQYGAALIRDSYFRDYAEALAEEIGAISSDLAGRWPYTCIDWNEAAGELKQDYTSVDFDGVTYWIR